MPSFCITRPDAGLRVICDEFGNQYRSYALFQTDDSGVVDVGAQQPLAGSYTEMDAMGLFWSQVFTPTTTFVTDEQLRLMHFTAEFRGTVVASTLLERVFAAPGVTQVAVRDDGLVGTFFRPASPGPHPGLLIVGGSNGGMPWAEPALLASHGYSTLALAYFGYEHLPPALVNIPLEHFATALRWLQAQETVRREHIAVLGWSRGGELALLLGATFPHIKAVVGDVPSGVIWGGLGGESSVQPPSAWSYGGHPLPFMPDRHTRAQLDAWRKGGEPYPETPLFLINLEDRAAVEVAAIPVEKINGPVLLISGEDDQLWPSTLLSEIAMDRLRKHQHPYPYQHLRYKGVGHLIGYPYVVSTITHRIHPANGVDIAYGGNAKDNAFARADSWSQVLRFLTESFARQAHHFVFEPGNLAFQVAQRL